MLVLCKLRIEPGMGQTEVISPHVGDMWRCLSARSVADVEDFLLQKEWTVSVQLGALETALINRREGHEEFVCTGRRENVLLASSPDYLTNCRASTRKGQCPLRPHLRQSQLHFSTNAWAEIWYSALIKKLPGLNFIVIFIRSCSVPLHLGKCRFMIEQGRKIRSSSLNKGSNTLL